MSARFSLGIDLGTSNSAVAIDDFESDHISIVEITQSLGPNQIGEKPTLPSALYIPHPEEFPEDRLPAAMDENQRQRDRRPLRPRSRRARSGSPDHIGQVMAIKLSHRPEKTGPTMEI